MRKQINALTDQMRALSDEELAASTSRFRQRLAAGESLDKILPEAFAVAREHNPPYLIQNGGRSSRVAAPV